MKMKIILSIILACLGISAFADDIQYHQQKLPDGSTVTEYGGPNAKIKQIQRPDGTIETHAIDSDGKQMITTQHPDGNIDVKTIQK